jgi:acyl-CoA reductase-like NAD-dependent aldehyde dehydrogenase
MKRLYVHESIYDEMCGELAKLADAAIIGDGLMQGTQIGPLQNRSAVEKVKEFLEDGKKNGKVIAGGVVEDRPGYHPADHRARHRGRHAACGRGTVWPGAAGHQVQGCRGCGRARECLALGSGGSVWAKDTAKAYALADKMEAGTVWVNKHADLAPNIPFGGREAFGRGTG